MLDGKEAIVAVIRSIDKKRELTPSDELIAIHYANDLNKPTSYEDVNRIFRKLQNDEKILKVVKTPEETEDHCWHLMIYKKFDKYHEQLKQTKEYEDYTGEKYIMPETITLDLDEIVEGEVLDELLIVKEAREQALKNQQEVFSFVNDIVLPQLDFKTPIIAAEVIKEAVEQMQQFNTGLAAFRNIFNNYEASIQNIVETGRQVASSFQIASGLAKQIGEMLATPNLLPAPKQTHIQEIQPKPTPSIEVELRNEMVELRNEMIRYRELVEQTTQPLLPAQLDEPPIRYDKNTKTIYIKGTPIQIDTNARSGNQFDLCDLIFKNKSTIKAGVSNAEIFTHWGNYQVDAQYVRANWRSIYHTVKRINEKISKKTFAPDFLECSKYKTKINKFYL